MRAMWGSLGLTVLVYLLFSVLICGGPLMPIALLTMYRDRLGAPYWPWLVAAAAAIAALGTLGACWRWRSSRFASPLFVGLWLVLSPALVGGYATYLRAREVTAFQPDSYIGSSFLSSLQNAPADFQFFLHAAALKGCKPYAWSYRDMAFYELPASAAVNVLPREWLDRCSIRRSD